MPMETIVTLAGNVGTDVWYTRPESGVARASFRVGVTPRVRVGDKWEDTPATTWLRVTCWRALADNAKASLRKGDPVFLSGRMRSETWTDADGVVKEGLVVEATHLGHDLGRGTSRFARSSAMEEAPMMESPYEASEAADAEAREELAAEGAAAPAA
ncbi:single-stranded DNA-binding protein [Nigerium massiliense]|uniref:single-stranded DNA-binding protein n=1 Tax=Nigerium massiliense TaxID=1522317 RepID=UPI000693721B|nr:single-stranded DNA-binding protein [Nigerium massiliense]